MAVPTGDAASAREAARRATHAQLDRYWAAIGALEPDVLGHLVSPSFLGGPAWPTTRQAYRIVRRGHSVILATDGMADPFDDLAIPGNGFGIEVFVETADVAAEHAGTPGDVGPLMGSWAFELLRHFAAQLAQADGVGGLLERLGVLSVESAGVSASPVLARQVTQRFITADDSIGVLVGQPAPDFPTLVRDMPLSPVRIVPVVLLTAAELGAIRRGGSRVRTEVAELLAKSPSRHWCDLHRPSVI